MNSVSPSTNAAVARIPASQADYTTESETTTTEPETTTTEMATTTTETETATTKPGNDFNTDGSEPATSPNPPIFTKGLASAARKRTFNLRFKLFVILPLIADHF